MRVNPPGTILQLIYLQERLRNIEPGFFLEIGPGSGEVCSLLLKLGWKGIAYDLESRTVARLIDRFSQEISEGRFEAKNEDYFLINANCVKKVNLVISCMVMEHLNKSLEDKLMRHSSELLQEGGLMIGLVPSSPAHWGIEDDIAGHYRRYTRDNIVALCGSNGWKIRHLAGLTYPISNILLPVSNFLVRRAEISKLTMSDIEKTKASGIRDVRFKTTFPNILSLVLNRHFLLPLHWIQKIFSSSSNSLVLYFEAKPQQLKIEGK